MPTPEELAAQKAADDAKKAGDVDPKIAELQKDPDAVAALLKAKREANAEAKSYREKLEALDKKNQDAERKALEDQGKFKELAEKEKSEKAEIVKRFSGRVIMNELRLEAFKAGIVDVDAVALVDQSGIKVGDDFTVTGAAEAVAALKKSKPYLFAATTDGRTTPPGTPTPNLKGTLLNPNLNAESVEDRITRGLEAQKK